MVDSILNVRGEIYVKTLRNRLKSTSLESLSQRIDKIRGDTVYFYLNRDDRDMLQAELYNFSVLTPPSQKHKITMASGIDEVLEGTAYPTYTQYLEIMEFFKDSFPGYCTIDTIGTSINGHLMLTARLGSSGKGLFELPRVALSSSLHGDEVTGYSLLLLLLKEILYHRDQLPFSEILENLHLFVTPMLNPDGTYFQSDESFNGATRFNVNGVDLNRNFPDPYQGDYPNGYSRQKETQAIMDYMQIIRPNLSANYHGGSEVVNYPFDCWSSLHADDDWFYFISREYADTARYYYPGYMNSSEFDRGVTNGYDWYQVWGGLQDYITYFLRGRDLTLEISNIKIPAESAIITYWNANKNAMINFIQQAMYGIHGRVIDRKTKEPLEALIELENHDSLNAQVFSSSASGMFFRYLKEGSYDLKVSANGYQTKHITDFSVYDYSTQNLLVELSGDDVKMYPNPFNREFYVFHYAENPGTAEVSIWNMKGALQYFTQFSLTPGENELHINPGIIFGGIYILEIKTEGKVERMKVVYEE